MAVVRHPENIMASPVTADNPVNAIVLSGGSAFGLAAADGVMKYLEERGQGYPTGFANVPFGLPVLYLRSWTGRCGSKTGCQYGGMKHAEMQNNGKERGIDIRKRVLRQYWSRKRSNCRGDLWHGAGAKRRESVSMQCH